VDIGLVTSTGAAANSTPYRDKVALYVAAVAQNGTGDVWAMNPLVTQEPNSGEYAAQVRLLLHACRLNSDSAWCFVVFCGVFGVFGVYWCFFGIVLIFRAVLLFTTLFLFLFLIFSRLIFSR
jgi:hypothetical protein